MSIFCNVSIFTFTHQYWGIYHFENSILKLLYFLLVLVMKTMYIFGVSPNSQLIQSQTNTEYDTHTATQSATTLNMKEGRSRRQKRKKRERERITNSKKRTLRGKNYVKYLFRLHVYVVV